MYLYLEDGTIIEGISIGADKEAIGEVVFTTAMNGYVESLTDPSYKGQILVFTHPHIGNYGIPKKEYINNVLSNFESEHIQVSGVVINNTNNGFKYNKLYSLSEWLKEENIPGIVIDDTRLIVKKIRDNGVMKGGLLKKESSKELVDNFNYSNIELINEVSPKEIIIHGNNRYKVLLFDFGVKHGIIRELIRRNLEVIRISYKMNFEKYINEVNGIVYSNGPGDPEIVSKYFDKIKELSEYKMPTFGICLGHQLIGIAFNGIVKKMKFGHRAINKGVFDVINKKAIITTHNHGYAIEKLPEGFKLWFYSIDDKVIEGMINNDLNIITTQFHPEAGPGPLDANYIFDIFANMVEKWR